MTDSFIFDSIGCRWYYIHVELNESTISQLRAKVMFNINVGTIQMKFENANEVARFVHDWTDFEPRDILDIMRRGSDSWTFVAGDVSVVVSKHG